MPTPPLPTDAELAILRVLWDRGPSTVAEVREVLDRDKRTGYTTVLKMLQIMLEKGLVVRDETRRTHVYDAAVSEVETQTQMIGDLTHRAFRGSAAKLVLRALSDRASSPAELEEIQAMLDRLTEGGR